MIEPVETEASVRQLCPEFLLSTYSSHRSINDCYVPDETESDNECHQKELLLGTTKSKDAMQWKLDLDSKNQNQNKVSVLWRHCSSLACESPCEERTEEE